MAGRVWTSPSPKIPAGRRDVVRSFGELGERFAAITRPSASAFKMLAPAHTISMFQRHIRERGETDLG